jgi:hypothetical protein
MLKAMGIVHPKRFERRDAEDAEKTAETNRGDGVSLLFYLCVRCASAFIPI